MADLYTVNCMVSLGGYASTLPIVHLLFQLLKKVKGSLRGAASQAFLWKEELVDNLPLYVPHIYGVGFVESIYKYFHFSSSPLTRINTTFRDK